MKLVIHSPFLFLLFLLASCGAYRQNILFKTEEQVKPDKLTDAVVRAEKNYNITPGDYLKIDVYTNRGESIIDPNMELAKTGQSAGQARPELNYLVQDNGMVKLPIVDTILLGGYTLLEAEQVLQQRYAEFYKEPFVKVSHLNKRVVVLGAVGGKVIPMNNDRINLIEVLALAGGLEDNAKGHNIRVIRGDLKDPLVMVIDLSTIEGMKAAQLDIFPGDVVYVEPIRKPFLESFRDVSPVFGLVVSLLTLYIIFLRTT